MATIRALFDAVDRNTKQVHEGFTLGCSICTSNKTSVDYIICLTAVVLLHVCDLCPSIAIWCDYGTL